MIAFCMFLLPCYSLCELLVCELILITMILSMKNIFFSWKMSSQIINLSMFFDKMSLYLAMMTMWISSLMLYTLSVFKMKHKNGSLFLSVVLMFILVSMFFSVGSIPFLILFELSMIPTMLLIIGWGYQPERLEAYFNFFFFTSIPSMPLLAFLLSSELQVNFISLSPKEQTFDFIFFMIFSAFLVKVPLYFSHFWLPKAHVEAPVAGSMVLAGILLKMGGYGLLRFIFFSKIFLFNFLISSVSGLGMMMTCFMCLLSPDLKSIIAYSSVSHMNFMIMGILTEKSVIFFGGLMLMLSHALSSSGLFYLCDVMYKRSMSRSLLFNKCTIVSSPLLSFWWFIFCMLNMAFPLTPGNFSEMFMGIVLVKTLPLLALIVLLMYFFFSAYYSIFVYFSVNHGSLIKQLSWSLSMKENLVLFSHFSPCILLSFFSFSFFA